ncbi:M81 family metallopeptidase [uncultured Tateyamaria sp.]|uniref:M81 family metallopeptidase n=1 Tax=uncultured Tateyamaria sp. TaxID=455651 RepID=UPI002608B66A|nr:M81 family metallopeptidase [uncultured Tateyamaria sp.]
MRIAIAGFQHETNTFVSRLTDLADFEQADSWPELLAGDAVVTGTQGMNLPIAGFAQACEEDVELCPILWCAAEPGGRVTDRAFDTIVSWITDALGQFGTVDAVYLDLHGAMVTQSHDDGEGEVLKRVRTAIGRDVPLVASLDMHANVSPTMVEISDLLTVFRTYPHIDMAETGARAYRHLRNMIAHGRLAKAWRQANFLIPLHAQHTGADPARSLYDQIAGFDHQKGQLAELALGFTAADVHDVGPSILAYAAVQSDADRVADEMLASLIAAEPEFDVTLMSADAAVSAAVAMGGDKPVVIADVQDNPGAGASSDTTGLLRALIQHRAGNAIVGLIHDPELAQRAHALGRNARFQAYIGGRGPNDAPVKARVRVHYLSDGRCPYTGVMYGGGIATLGPSAALEIEGTGIHVVITSVRNQCLDLAQFRHFNLLPERARVLCVKSTAHFRADFAPIAQAILLAEAPGQFPCALESVVYENTRKMEIGLCERSAK